MRVKHLTVIVMTILSLSLGACNVDDTRDNQTQMEGQQMKVGQISSDSTTISSNKYPHTKPIQVQHAKYQFDITDESDQHHKTNAQFTKEEIAQLIPEGTSQLTQEEITRLLPEGAINLSPDEIAQLIRERIPTKQPAQEQPEAQPQPPAQKQPEAQPQPPAQKQPEAQPQPPAQKQPEAQPQPEKKSQTESDQTNGITKIEMRVISLTNDERSRNGLPDLQPDTALTKVAREKSNDMQANNYFSHTSPTYGSPFDMMRDFDVSYQAAGENIAQGQPTPEQVVQAWMNSEGHRANILNGNYTHIGIGYNQNGHYWTQMFISK